MLKRIDGREVVIAGATGAFLFLLQMLLQFDPAVVEDWRAWAFAAIGGAVRGAAAAMLSVLAARKARKAVARA